MTHDHYSDLSFKMSSTLSHVPQAYRLYSRGLVVDRYLVSAFLFNRGTRDCNCELVSHIFWTFNATDDFLGFRSLRIVGNRAAQSNDPVLNINIDCRISQIVLVSQHRPSLGP